MPSRFRLRKVFDQLGWVFLGLIALRLLSSPTADAAYLLLALYALAGRAQAVEALLLSFLFNNLNTDIFPAGSVANVARYLVVGTAAMSVFFRSRLLRNGRADPVFLTVFLLSLFFLLHSMFFSAVPIISVLKSAIWGLAFLTLLLGWGDADLTTAQRIEFRIFVVLGGCVILSLLLMFQSAAYVPRTTYLRGVLGHSQALGLVAATVAVYALFKALSTPRPSIAMLALFGTALITVLETNSRTALVALAATILIVLAVSLFGKTGRRSGGLPGLKSVPFVVTSTLALGAVIVGSSAIQNTFIKRSRLEVENATLTELYQESRGGLAAQMWANIEADPWLGIGFGLASNLQEMEITYFQGVPVGAVVEKGITILAVWEEVGLIGLVIFTFFLFQLFARGMVLEREKLAVFLVIILTNFGEATLLSAGGAGLIQLVLLGWMISGNRGRRPVPASSNALHKPVRRIV